MAISARQRCHYEMLTQQQAARTNVIGALVDLSRFPDDSDAAIHCLRLLDASSAEIDAAANELMRQDVSVHHISAGPDRTSDMAFQCDTEASGGG